MTSAEKYVTAAYLVFLAVVLAYVVIFATKLSRLDRELAELTALAKGTGGKQPGASGATSARQPGSSPEGERLG